MSNSKNIKKVNWVQNYFWFYRKLLLMNLINTRGYPHIPYITPQSSYPQIPSQIGMAIFTCAQKSHTGGDFFSVETRMGDKIFLRILYYYGLNMLFVPLNIVNFVFSPSKFFFTLLVPTLFFISIFSPCCQFSLTVLMWHG